MGNAVKVRLKEDDTNLEITEALIKGFQDHINQADHSMTGFAKSVDSMRAACEMLLRQHDSKKPQSEDSTTGTDNGSVDSVRLAHRLLETIDSSISDYKFVVMESLSKLFRFVMDVGRSYTVSSEDCPLVFLVDKYRAQNTNVEVEDKMMYCDARIRSLQKELKKLHDADSFAKREIRILNKREETYRKEIETLKSEAESQKKRIEEMLSDENMTVFDFEDADTLKSGFGEERYKVGGKQQHVGEVRDSDREKVKLLSVNLQDTKEAKEYKLQIEALKNENAGLKEDNERLRNDIETVRDVTEKTLKRKSDELDDLKRMQSHRDETVDKETTKEDIDELSKEIDNLKLAENDKLKEEENDKLKEEENDKGKDEENDKLKEEVKSLRRDLALKSRKVLQVVEYEFSIFENSSEKKDIYQTIRCEMALHNIDLQITTRNPSKIFGVLNDEVAIIPLTIRYSGDLKRRMRSAFTDLTAKPNIAVLIIYYVDNDRVIKDVDEPVEEEFKKLGGIFKFAFSYVHLEERITDKNKETLNSLLTFLKCEGSEDRYISR